MIYFHDPVCISAQHSHPTIELDPPVLSVNNKLTVIEPPYPGIPPGALRRMGKAVRIGVGAGLAALHSGVEPDGIVIGTGNGGMEDCIKFLDQIIEYNEGLLTPGNFVQSTANAIGSQISLIKKNKKYSCTHVHRGLAFENALLDVMLLLEEFPAHRYLLGAVDEISDSNYNIDLLAGWFSRETFSSAELFSQDHAATIAGEGAFMTIVDTDPANATASLRALHFIEETDPLIVQERLRHFLQQSLPAGESIDMIVSGDNGDRRHRAFAQGIEAELPGIEMIRFKQLSGEFPTAAAFGCWLSIQLLSGMAGIHSGSAISRGKRVENILLYNHYRGQQHAFYLLSAVSASSFP